MKILLVLFILAITCYASIMKTLAYASTVEKILKPSLAKSRIRVIDHYNVFGEVSSQDLQDIVLEQIDDNLEVDVDGNKYFLNGIEVMHNMLKAQWISSDAKVRVTALISTNAIQAPLIDTDSKTINVERNDLINHLENFDEIYGLGLISRGPTLFDIPIIRPKIKN